MAEKTAKHITWSVKEKPNAATIAEQKQANPIFKKNNTGVNISIIHRITPAMHHICHKLIVSIKMLHYNLFKLYYKVFFIALQ